MKIVIIFAMAAVNYALSIGSKIYHKIVKNLIKFAHIFAFV